MPLQYIPVHASIPKNIQDLYETSFPLNERRPWEQQQVLMAESSIHLLQLETNNVFVGFVFYWNLEYFTFIEHFAIVDTARGQGMGGMVMKHLAGKYPFIVLEAEPPETSEAARRRISFYKKLGFQLFPFAYRQPPYPPGQAFLPMKLLHNSQACTQANFENVKQVLYETVYHCRDAKPFG